MADLPTPAAARLQRPSWRDRRLLIGVLLVLLSTVLGAKAVAVADDTTPMYAAATALVPGQQVGPGDLVRVDVQLGADRSSYVPADHAVGSDTFALRDVRAGELVPRTALGPGASVTVKPVTLPVDATAAAVLVRGSVVDVWVNPRDLSSPTPRFPRPQRMFEAAVVARVPEGGTGLALATGTTAVQVLVPGDRVEPVIAAIDQGAKITLVPVAGSPLKALS